VCYLLWYGNESDVQNVTVIMLDVYRLVPHRFTEMSGPVVVPTTPRHSSNMSFCVSECKGNKLPPAF